MISPADSTSAASDSSDQTVNRPLQIGRVATHVTEARFVWMLHAYAAFAIAIAAPMFGRLQQRTPYLISMEPATIVIFIGLWSVALPGLVLLLLAAVRTISPAAGRIALKCLVGISITITLLGILGHRSGMAELSWLVVLVCAATGLIAGVWYRSWTSLQTVLTLSAWGSLIFPISLAGTYVRDTARPNFKSEITSGNPVPVVVVIFDCLSGINLMDQRRLIDKDRYPRFAELAATSNWYRNCTSVHPRTDQAIPAILTGQRPNGYRAPTVQQYPQNLFSLLSSTGDYKLTVFEPFTRLCAPDPTRDRAQPKVWTQWRELTDTMGIVFLHDLLPNGIPLDLPRIPRTWFALEHALSCDPEQRQGLVRYGWSHDRDHQFHHFVDCLQETDQPTLWLGHFALPHLPWIYLPSGNQVHQDVGLGEIWGAYGEPKDNWVDDDRIATESHQQHLLQLGYTDRLLGELLDQLRRVGLFDRCMLVVMSDHGVSFRPGMSARAPTERNLAEIMSVPLFIKLPGQKTGDVVDLSVETTDVLPTILDVLKVEPPVPLDGRSVIDPEFSERPHKQFFDDIRHFEVDASFESRYDVLAEQLGRFGTGEDPLRIFKIGPQPGMLGKRLEDFALSTPSSIRVHPMNFSKTADYGSSGMVSAHLEARIESKSEKARPVQFAIAVNDTIWGTTQSYQFGRYRDFFRVMLPESAFVPGSNQIRVFQIQSTSTGMILAECSISEKVELRRP